MFLSGPYSDVLTQVDDISLENDTKRKKNKTMANDVNIIQSLHVTKSLSLSEGNVNKIERSKKNISRSLYNKLEPNTRNISRSLNSLNYDADTENDSEPEMVKLPEWEWELRCDICRLQYSSPFESTFTVKENDDEDSPKHDRKAKRKLFRRRIEKRKPFNPVVGGVNFEEFKDANHKLDKFDPTSERVWTLQYTYDEYIPQPKLSKIIIGRGHRNEFPELNNIYLMSDAEKCRETSWRNEILQNLKSKNTNIDSAFNYVSTNQSCLFCLYERNISVNEKVKRGEPLCHVTPTINVSDTDTGNDIKHSTDGVVPLKNSIPQNKTKKRFDLMSKLKPIIKQAIDDTPEEIDEEEFTFI